MGRKVQAYPHIDYFLISRGKNNYRELGRWVMCLLHRHEGLSLNPLHPWKNQVLSYMLATSSLGVPDKGITKAHWPANLFKVVSFGFSERPCLKNESGKR